MIKKSLFHKVIMFFCFLSFSTPLSASHNFSYADTKEIVNQDIKSQDIFDPFDEINQSSVPEQTISDPLEAYNRVIFVFNDRLYFWLLKPAATGYRYILPEPARRSMKRFFSNLSTPVRFVNSILQTKFAGAGIEFYRFAVNSTVGIGGLFDPAYHFCGLKRFDEDTDQTLGVYGSGYGFYIMWPFFGPSSIRGTFGMAGDILLDPLFYLNIDFLESAGVEAFQAVNSTSLKVGEYEDFKKSAIDPYISLRNAYFQNRESLVRE